MTDGSSGEEFVVVGRVRKAHGIRGDLVVEPFTGEPGAVFAPGRRVFAGTPDGAPARDRAELHITAASPFKEGLIVHVAEIGDRSAAETWRGRTVLVPADELRPLDDGEAYLHELLGMRVVLESGEVVGEVSDIFELPQGLGLDVGRADGGGTVMLLYERTVVDVDRDTRVITVTVPAGMLD